jgi:hypothetical protein
LSWRCEAASDRVERLERFPAQPSIIAGRVHKVGVVPYGSTLEPRQIVL